MPKRLTKSQKRIGIEKLAKLIESESHYAPLDDPEIAKRTGFSVAMARYYRRQYFRLGNSFERRAEYLRKKKQAGILPQSGLEEDEPKPQDKRNTKARATAKKTSRSRSKAKSKKR